MKMLNLKDAIDLLADGEIVAIPTETVYGLAADARCDMAVNKIFEAKKRPSDNPLIVHIGDVSQVDSLATDISEKARLLMGHFWPGPLTLILPCANVVSKLVTAGLNTIALRIPKHKIALKLLSTSGIPLAAPSANISGKPSPIRPEHVMHDMENRIAGIIAGGVCEIGLESTVIDMTAPTPVILRPGSITQEEIEAVIGPINIPDFVYEHPKSPGTKYTHYAPDAQLFIVKGSHKFFKSIILENKKKGLRIGVLCHMSNHNFYRRANVSIGISNNGRKLYDTLRKFNRYELDIILSEEFEDAVVMDRLMKASNKRVLVESEIGDVFTFENEIKID